MNQERYSQKHNRTSRLLAAGAAVLALAGVGEYVSHGSEPPKPNNTPVLAQVSPKGKANLSVDVLGGGEGLWNVAQSVR